MNPRFFQQPRAMRVLGSVLIVGGLLGACDQKLPAQTTSSKQVAQSQTTGSYGPWKSASIGGGGFLQQAVFAPSDSKVMYMTSDVGGLFGSRDGGKTWRMLHGSLPADAGSYGVRGIAVHPRDPNRVLIGIGDAWGSTKGVWLTRDGGKTWQQKSDMPFQGNGWHRSAGNVVVMSPHNSNLVIVGSLGGGIARSEDGGDTWTRSGPDDLSPVHILFDRSNAQRVWLCAKDWGEVKVKRANGQEVGLRGGLFLSEDAGKTWTQINNEQPSEIVQDPQDSKILWGIIREKRVVRSTDLGHTWVEYSQGLAPYTDGDARKDGTYDALAVGPDFILTGAHGGHFYRLDKGATTWKKIEPEKVNEGSWWGRMEKFRHFGSALGYVGIDPRDPKHWVFTDWYALYQSWDAGKTWTLSIDGVEMTVLNTVAQEPTNPEVFHAGMADIGYFRSPDGGRSMVQITKDISNNIKNIATAPGQPGRVYATGPREWQWHANELFISDDAGLTWRRSGLNGIPDMANRRSETVAPHPAKKDEVWITISGDIKPNEGGPWRSLDGGKTWSWQGEGLPQDGEFFHRNYWVAGPELAISPDGSMIATSNMRGLMARRAPGETSWTMVKVPAGGPNCVAADVLRPGRFYVAMKEGGLWRTDDGGKTWKDVVERDVFWVSPDMKKANRVAATTRAGVLVSTDAGATWREAGKELPYRHPRNSVCFAGEKIVVGTGGNGVFYAPLSALNGTPKSMARREEKVTTIAKVNNIIQNGNMTRGEATPSDWNLASWKEGHLLLRRDMSTHVSAPASLVLETKGKATGVAQQSLQPTPKGDIKVSGQIRTEGNFDNVQVVLQVFDAQWKQIDWKVVANGPKTTTNWTTFSGTQNVRDDAAYVLLNLSVSGNGKVWLDDVSTTSASAAVAQNNAVTSLPVQIAANDSRLRYVGRFDWSVKTAPRSAWSASSITVRFRGTDLNARLRGGNNVRWQIEVDGKPTEKIKVGEGENLYRVASGLKNGEHTVRLIQATEALFGTTQVLGWQLNQGAQLLPVAAKSRGIEIIGDSISAGYGNEAASKDEKFSPDTQNAYFTYGAIAARELNAEYTCLAWSGKKMWPDNTLPELYDHIIPTEANSKWDFSKWTPDVVLINLATNDFNGRIPDEAGWTKAYVEFIARVRKNYPKTQIYCAIGTMMGDWGEGKPLTALRTYLKKVVEQTNDPKVKIIDFGTQDAANGLGADWHPNIKTNQIMAAQLVETLRKDMKW